jgi:hypothetical protein
VAARITKASDCFPREVLDPEKYTCEVIVLADGLAVRTLPFSSHEFLYGRPMDRLLSNFAISSNDAYGSVTEILLSCSASSRTGRFSSVTMHAGRPIHPTATRGERISSLPLQQISTVFAHPHP